MFVGKERPVTQLKIELTCAQRSGKNWACNSFVTHLIHQEFPKETRLFERIWTWPVFAKK